MSDFHIEDHREEAANKLVFMGDEIEIKGKPRLRIKGSYIITPPEDLKVEIIRNGQIIKEFKFGNEGIFNLDFQDVSFAVPFKKSYYRINFFANGKIILVTNPIFIKI